MFESVPAPRHMARSVSLMIGLGGLFVVCWELLICIRRV